MFSFLSLNIEIKIEIEKLQINDNYMNSKIEPGTRTTRELRCTNGHLACHKKTVTISDLQLNYTDGHLARHKKTVTISELQWRSQGPPQ